jgi:hypothetical protein
MELFGELFGELFKKPLPLVPSQEGKHKNSNQKKNFTFFTENQMLRDIPS